MLSDRVKALEAFKGMKPDDIELACALIHT